MAHPPLAAPRGGLPNAHAGAGTGILRGSYGERVVL